MVQEILVGILFIIAVVYLAMVFRKQAKAKSSCGSAGCKCEPTDSDKINRKKKQESPSKQFV